MRIGIFTDDYFPHISGVVTATIALRDGLVEQGHEVYLIVPKHKALKDEPHVIQIVSANAIVQKDLRAALPSRKYLQRVLDLDLDIVHSMTQYNIGVFADHIARKANIPHVTTLHTLVPELMVFYPTKMAAAYVYCATLYLLYFGERAQMSWPKRQEVLMPKRGSISMLKRQIWNLQNVFLNNTDHIIAPSSHAEEQIIQHHATPPTSVIPSSVNAVFYSHERTRSFMEDGKLKIVCVSRLSSEKRQDVAILAASMVDNVQLEIIGEGPTSAELRRLVRDLHLTGRVNFHGAQSAEYIRDQLLNADALILASHNFDSQGVVMVEAAATGLPVLYCDPKLSSGAAPGASILTNPHAKGIAKGMRQLQTMDFNTMSDTAHEFAKNFHYYHVATQSAKLYKVLTDRYLSRDTV